MASPRDPHVSPRRVAALATIPVAALVLTLSACGDDTTSQADRSSTSVALGTGEIEGLTRPDPLQVGELSLPEVAPDGAETPFAFTASPGNLLFAAFGYTNCPDVCPTTLYDIKKAKKLLGDDGDKVQVAFATVDPDRDTPEVMNQYLGSFTDSGHPLRTTDTDELAAVEDGFGITSEVVTEPDGEVKVAHTARSFLIDDQGQVVVEWAFGTSPEVMANDIAILLDRQAASS
jgi:protein SCO1/2